MYKNNNTQNNNFLLHDNWYLQPNSNNALNRGLLFPTRWQATYLVSTNLLSNNLKHIHTDCNFADLNDCNYQRLMHSSAVANIARVYYL